MFQNIKFSTVTIFSWEIVMWLLIIDSKSIVLGTTVRARQLFIYSAYILL